MSIMVFLFILFPVATNAQATSGSASGVLGFTKCNFDASAAGGKGTQLVRDCIGQILTFVFVVSLFLIAIRVATSALGNYNPLSNGNADKEAISLVYDVTLGLILIGGPVIILNTINPASLNLDIFDLTKLSQTAAISSGDKTTGGGGSTSTASKPTSPTVKTKDGKTLTPEEVKKAAEKSKETKAAYMLPNIKNIFIPNVLAQELSQSETDSILSSVLSIESTCSNIFIPSSEVDNCVSLENDFTDALNSIDPSDRKNLLPLNDTKKELTGKITTLRDIIVQDIQISPTETLKPNCSNYYASVQIKDNAIMQNRILSGLICNDNVTGYKFWRKESNSIAVDVMTIPARTEISPENSLLYLL